METCVPNSSRGRPRTAETLALEDAIIEVISTDAPVSVRQVYYRLVAEASSPSPTRTTAGSARGC